MRTLHPQVFATRYTWWRDTDEAEVFTAPHEVLETREHRESPYVPILEGAGGVRRFLDGPDTQFDFPILRELHARGATDYVAMPLFFLILVSLATPRSEPGFNLTASDPDYPDNELSFTLVDAPSGASITAGGGFTWTPTEAQGPGEDRKSVV